MSRGFLSCGSRSRRLLDCACHVDESANPGNLFQQNFLCAGLSIIRIIKTKHKVRLARFLIISLPIKSWTNKKYVKIVAFHGC